MKDKQDNINRRNFLKTMGTASLGGAAVLSGCGKREKEKAADPNATVKEDRPKLEQVPRRILSRRVPVEVSCLALGTMFDTTENQVVLRKAIEWGVDYWDTAHNYSGGNSERGIGKFLKDNPQVRKRLFLVTKASGAKAVEDVEKCLQTSLKRMNTDYIDLYYGVHVLDDISQLKDELKSWAEDTKKRGLIRYFGFSTHKNMDKNLAAASKLDWIDAILTTYNFRVMQKLEFQDAIEACHKAGIGLTAMKTQGLKIETAEDKKLTDHFLQRGFTEAQAKIKVVLEDKRFGSVAARMKNVALLTTDVAAALDKTELSQADKQVFREYAQQTCSGYCVGCAEICDAALPNTPYVSDIMRYLMYYNSYGDKDKARELFGKLPQKVRGELLSTNYKLAEARCPQHLPIGKLVAEAVSKLA